MKKLPRSFNFRKQMQDLDLLTFVSHQIKTPLTTLKLNVDLLKQQISLKQKKIIDIMDEELNTIIRLISESLDLRKMESGSSALLQKWHNWDHLVESSVQQLKTFLNHQKIQVNIKPLKNKIEVYVDSLYIQQMLINLITNATEHSPPNSQIHLSWTLTKKNELKTMVEDEGVGIKAQDLDKVFTSFYSSLQSNRTLSNRTLSNKQRGLGLMIARQIVISHGGSIQAISNHATQGACFTFTLPNPRILHQVA